MADYTDITVLVDRSGSMERTAKEMEQAFDSFLKEHQKNQSTRLTLIRFNGTNPQLVDYVNVPIRVAEGLRINAIGTTPLYDALATAIDNTGKRLRDMDEKDRPSKVLFVVITDGEENASKWATAEAVGNRIKTQTNNYSWQFIYLGANQDSWKVSQTLHIPWTNTITWTQDSAHIGETYRSLTANTVAYASAGGSAADLNWSEQQRVKSATKADRDQNSGGA